MAAMFEQGLHELPIRSRLCRSGDSVRSDHHADRVQLLSERAYNPGRIEGLGPRPERLGAATSRAAPQSGAASTHPPARRRRRPPITRGRRRETPPGLTAFDRVHDDVARVGGQDAMTGAIRQAKTFVFFPEGAFGPTNNCVGIGDVLRRRGHRVAFVVEESFRGTLEAKGFEEHLMRLGPPPSQPEAPGQFWKDFIRDTAPVFRRSTLDQLDGFIAPTWQALVDGARYVDSRLAAIFDELRPDVIVEDNVVSFPAISSSGRPWVRIASCNPLELKSPDLPPTFSGFAIDDRSHWSEFQDEYARRVGRMQAEFSEFCVEHGAPPLPELEFIHESPWLNLYLYPAELDYPRSRPLAATWHNLETSVRSTDPAWDPPSRSDSALIYVSLGSLGSADVALMERLVEVLSRTPHRCIVSKGPQHEAYELAENMTGGEFLPQTSILPHVDLVITHGGNNTTTECMYFGKPMIVLPIFWDQHDNAQRVHETSYGVRLPTYSFEDEDLVGAIDRLLTDKPLRRRMEATSSRLQARPGTQRAADLIEGVAFNLG